MTDSAPRKLRPRRHPATRMLAALLLASGLGAASVQRASTQDRSPAAAKPAAAEVAPRGQRTADDIKYGEWRKLCFKAAGVKTLCRTSIIGRFETGRMAVRLDLIERDGDTTARWQLFVPVGMYLPVPAQLSVKPDEPYRLPYTWCLTNACIAADVADPRLVKEMESGQSLMLEVVDSNLLSLKTPVPLAQFATVHNGAPAQTLEQDIEE